jgi:hypothetical protein
MQKYIEYEINTSVTRETGRDRSQWRIIAADGFTLGAGRSDFTFVENRRLNSVLWRMETGRETPVVREWAQRPPAVLMRYGHVGYHFGTERMDGESLVVYADVWFGTNGDTVLVSEFRQEHVHFW